MQNDYYLPLFLTGKRRQTHRIHVVIWRRLMPIRCLRFIRRWIDLLNWWRWRRHRISIVNGLMLNQRTVVSIAQRGRQRWIAFVQNCIRTSLINVVVLGRSWQIGKTTAWSRLICCVRGDAVVVLRWHIKICVMNLWFGHGNVWIVVRIAAMDFPNVQRSLLISNQFDFNFFAIWSGRRVWMMRLMMVFIAWRIRILVFEANVQCVGAVVGIVSNCFSFVVVCGRIWMSCCCHVHSLLTTILHGNICVWTIAACATSIRMFVSISLLIHRHQLKSFLFHFVHVADFTENEKYSKKTHISAQIQNSPNLSSCRDHSMPLRCYYSRRKCILYVVRFLVLLWQFGDDHFLIATGRNWSWWRWWRRRWNRNLRLLQRSRALSWLFQRCCLLIWFDFNFVDIRRVHLNDKEQNTWKKSFLIAKLIGHCIDADKHVAD